MTGTSRLGAAVGLGAAVALTIGAVMVTGQPHRAAANREDASGFRPSSVPLARGGGATRQASFQDFVTGPRAAAAPTADKAQSKLWYAQNAWWGVLLDPKTQAFRIHRLDWASQVWQDTATVVDERPFSTADVLWDGTHLYIATAGSAPYLRDAARLLRFTWDGAHTRWALDKGFPVALTRTGVGTLVIDRDSTGKLWISYLEGGRLTINRSVGSDTTWGTPFVIPPAQAAPAAARALLLAAGKTIAVLWSNSAENSISLAVHHDGRPDEEWDPRQTILTGFKAADDHLSAKAVDDDGEVTLYVALKTSLDTVAQPKRADPQVLLLKVQLDGTVTRYLYGRVSDHHTRPVVLVDPETRDLFVVATSPFGGGEIYYKRTSLDNVAFTPGFGIPLIQSDIDRFVNDATSTKQAVTRQSGLVVVAFDSTTGRYLHGTIDLGGVGWAAAARTGGEPAAASAPPSPSPAPSGSGRPASGG